MNRYSSFIYHLVWSTKHRLKIIDQTTENIIRPYLKQQIMKYGGHYHACNMVSDHIHVLCEIPATFAVSEFIGKIKGSTSHEVNIHNQLQNFAWQKGFGGFSVSKKDLKTVATYIHRQKELHANTNYDHPWEIINTGNHIKSQPSTTQGLINVSPVEGAF